MGGGGGSNIGRELDILSERAGVAGAEVNDDEEELGRRIEDNAFRKVGRFDFVVGAGSMIGGGAALVVLSVEVESESSCGSSASLGVATFMRNLASTV